MLNVTQKLRKISHIQSQWNNLKTMYITCGKIKFSGKKETSNKQDMEENDTNKLVELINTYMYVYIF